MKLNEPRIQMRMTAALMDAIEYAKGGQLPFLLFDAISRSEEEASIRQLEANMARMTAELLRGG